MSFVFAPPFMSHGRLAHLLGLCWRTLLPLVTLLLSSMVLCTFVYSLIFEVPVAGIFGWLNFWQFFFCSAAGTLTLSPRLQRPLVRLRPRRDVPSVVTGAAPGSLIARCVALSVLLCLIMFSPLCPLTIDPAGSGRSPAGPGAT